MRLVGRARCRAATTAGRRRRGDIFEPRRGPSRRRTSPCRAPRPPARWPASPSGCTCHWKAHGATATGNDSGIPRISVLGGRAIRNAAEHARPDVHALEGGFVVAQGLLAPAPPAIVVEDAGGSTSRAAASQSSSVTGRAGHPSTARPYSSGIARISGRCADSAQHRDRDPRQHDRAAEHDLDPGTLAEDQIREDRGAHRLGEQRDRDDRGLELPQQVVDHRVAEELRSDRHRDEQRPHLRGVPEERRARRQHRDPEERRRDPVDRRRVRHEGQLGAHMPPDHDVDRGEDRAGDGEQVAQRGVRAAGGAARGRDDHAAGDRRPRSRASRGAWCAPR